MADTQWGGRRRAAAAPCSNRRSREAGGTLQGGRAVASALAVVACLMVSDALLAQETRTIDGKKFTVHAVQQGQTLFAISRAYAVPVEDLLKANPAARDGLSIGQELLIPQAAVVKKEARTAPVMAKDGELIHTVGKKETLFGIARRYGLDINDLLERNPELTEGLKEGVQVVIPVKAAAPGADAARRPAEPMHLVEHTVQPGETLFGIGQRYGVRPEEIQRANDGLPEGLKAGAIIRIPQRGEAPPPIRAAEPVRPPGEVRRIGLLLPFSVQRNDSALEATALATGGPRFHEASRIAAQFYAGALLALDSLEQQGLRAEVMVIDVGDDAAQWTAALKDPAIAGLELCIGPFHRSAIEQLARAQPRLPVICPVPQSNKIVLGLPNVSKASSSRSDLLKHAARYVAVKHARDNIIVLRPDIAGERDLQDQVLAALNAALGNQAARLRDSASIVVTGRRDIGALAARLDASALNVIVAPSEDVEFVTALVTKLKPFADKRRILLVGTEAWLGMAPVAATDLDALGFTFAAGSFLDPLEARTAAFMRRFRDRFHSDPDEYAALGFDVTYQSLLGLMGPAGGDAWRWPAASTEPLHMGFRMSRTGPENGFRNEYAVMLQQKDLQLVKAP